MTKELNIFKNNDLASFGDKPLMENLKDAETAISELSQDFRLHNHSNTQFAWNHFVISHKGGLRNIRQITAEINMKNMALNEAKHKHNRLMIEADLLQEMLSTGSESQHPRLIQADIDKINDDIKMSLAPIEGAIKDILILKGIYDQILPEGHNYTEQEFEDAEITYWIHRLFSQALRDIRQSGIIMSGNQEAIEQMGLNLSKVQDDMMRYLDQESEDKSLGNNKLREFLNLSTKKYIDTIKLFCGYGGFDSTKYLEF